LLGRDGGPVVGWALGPVVHEDIQLPRDSDRLRKAGIEGIGIHVVEGDAMMLGGATARELGRAVAGPGGITARDDDRGARLGERRRQRATEVAAAAGDQGHLSGQVEQLLNRRLHVTGLPKWS